MALEQITFNLGALDDAANSGKNYVSGQVFEVFNIDDTYASIFADSAGTIPIDQSGIQNISNSDGECKFFIDKGFYNIKSGGKTRQLNANFSFEFDTVSDAVNARFISLIEGRRVFIVERGAYFNVVLSSSFSGGNAQGKDEITSSSNSSYGFKLSLISGSNEVDPYWFGANGSEGFDNSDFIERAAEALGGGLLSFSVNGKYELSRTVYLPVGVSIDGNTGNRSFAGNFEDTVQFASQSYEGTNPYVENFLFFLNIDPNGDTETWVTQFPNNGSGSIKRVSVDGSASGGINGFKFAGSYEFENIDHRWVGSLIRKPSSLYTDKVKAKRIHGRERANNTDYMLDLPGSGDSPEIESIESGIIQGASFPAPESGTTRGLRLGPARGAFISGLINGNHVFQQGKYDIANLHLEHGVIEVLNGDTTIRDSDIFNEADKPVPIKLISQSAGGFGQRFKIKLQNIQFSSRVESSLGGWPTELKADIQTNPNFDIEIEGCSRRISTTNSQIVSQQYMGVILQDEGEVLFDEFNNYSHVLSKGCEINNNTVLALKSSASLLNGTFGGVLASLATETSSESYNGGSGTYFYQAQVLTDNQRAWGRNATNSETSIALSSGGTIPKLNIVWSSIDFRSALIVRVYKGTSPGSYDQFVDVPIYSCQTLYDNGDALNGLAWQSRTAGVVTALNNGSHGSTLIEAGLSTCKQTSLVPPTVGFWRQGDKVEILNPTTPTTGTAQPFMFIRKTNGNGTVIGIDWLQVNNYEP